MIFCALSQLPTKIGGSPGRRSHSTMLMSRLVTCRAVSITCRTEKPLPLPKLNNIACLEKLHNQAQSQGQEVTRHEAID